MLHLLGYLIGRPTVRQRRGAGHGRRRAECCEIPGDDIVDLPQLPGVCPAQQNDDASSPVVSCRFLRPYCHNCCASCKIFVDFAPCTSASQALK
nr:MAG TPA: hypothetical protein [Caudoviricetes sp.]